MQTITVHLLAFSKDKSNNRSDITDDEKTTHFTAYVSKEEACWSDEGETDVYPDVTALSQQQKRQGGSSNNNFVQ